MAQDRAVPARQDRREPAPLTFEHRVTHCVHAVMQAMEPPRPYAPLHRVFGQAQRPQLRDGHHTPLPRSQFCDPPVRG